LEQENGRLKKLVAERDLEIEVMKEITRKTGRRADSSALGALDPRALAPTGYSPALSALNQKRRISGLEAARARASSPVAITVVASAGTSRPSN
jgi:hypothetical protein